MAAPAPRPVVLVVEDDPNIRELLRFMLAEAGYEAMAVADGAAALTALETVRPDLVTLDLQLPGIDGAEVLRRMRRTPSLRALPVVIISGRSAIPSRTRRQAQGV